jgi:uncharacterized membrane protein YhaH (DUF805 family)
MWGWVAHCFRNYAVFNGRAGRPEYWWFFLFILIVDFALQVVTRAAPTPGLITLSTWTVLTVAPTWAVASRRLHDTGHSLWWNAAPLVPMTPIMILRVTHPAFVRGSGNVVTAAMFAATILLLAFVILLVRVLILLCRTGDPGPNRYGDSAPTTPG